MLLGTATPLWPPALAAFPKSRFQFLAESSHAFAPGGIVMRLFVTSGTGKVRCKEKLRGKLYKWKKGEQIQALV
jgi:hypothetical protein